MSLHRMDASDSFSKIWFSSESGGISERVPRFGGARGQIQFTALKSKLSGLIEKH